MELSYLASQLQKQTIRGHSESVELIWFSSVSPSRAALGPTQPPIQWIPGLYWGQSGRGVALNTHPHPAPRLKEEYSYTSAPILGLRGLF
jgi:hypothetical protein